jgi:hypothetical protein
MVSLSVLRLLEILPIIPPSMAVWPMLRLLEWQGFTLSKRSNPIALAMLNYVQTVDRTFGLMSDPRGMVAPTESEDAE